MFFIVSNMASYQVIATTDLPSCAEVSQQNNFIADLIRQGSYRFVKTNSSPLAKFDYAPARSFAEYLSYAYQNIVTKNPQAERKCAIATPSYPLLVSQEQRQQHALVADLIAPFELGQPNHDKAILLIHGLTDSPYSFHDLAAFFHQQGFTVRTLLLPGHGTAAEELITTDLADWQQASEYAIERTLADFKQVYLGGYSAGGALIFDYLLQRKNVDNKISGLIMWAPAIAAKSELAWLAGYLNYLPWFTWLEQGADIDFAKYESFPVNAAAQVNKLMNRVNGHDDSVKRYFHDIPLMTIASEADQTINSQAILQFSAQWHQQKKSVQENKISADRFIYYGHVNQAKQYLPTSIQLHIPKCERGELCQRVVDIAHLAMTHSPKNEHYGELASYRNCEHYRDDSKRYLLCKNELEVKAGEISAENLENTPLLKRLTYNPHYQKMLKQLMLFLQETAH